MFMLHNKRFATILDNEAYRTIVFIMTVSCFGRSLLIGLNIPKDEIRFLWFKMLLVCWSMCYIRNSGCMISIVEVFSSTYFEILR
jgi:hypothetical protein